MSKAQLLDTLPNNFVMKSDTMYCCRTGEALLLGSAVNADRLTELQSNGELETFGYPGSIMLPREAVSDAAVQYRWGKRSNGEYKPLAGYEISVHNVSVLESVGLVCKVSKQTVYTAVYTEAPSEPEPTKAPKVKTNGGPRFGGTPEVSKPANKPAKKPSALHPSLAAAPLWPNKGARFMQYRSRLKAAFDLSNEDAIKVAKAVNDKYKAGNMEYSPVQIANAILNANMKQPAAKKPAIEMPAPPKERTIRVHADALKSFLNDTNGKVVAVHSDTQEYSVAY